MREQLVSYKTAKLAKEKGFDVLKTEIDRIMSTYYTWNPKPLWWQFKKQREYDKRPKYHAPSYQRVNQWLIESHDMYVQLTPLKKSFRFTIYLLDKPVGDGYEQLVSPDFEHEFYTKTLDEGIYTALNLIKL